MARAHFVKKARKDNPAVKKGESYYYWQFRHSGKSYSATRPSRSQLTRSGFYSQQYGIEDDLLGKIDGEMSWDAIEAILDDACSQVEEMGSECQDNLYNLPEALQESHMLNERVEACEAWHAELEEIKGRLDEDTHKDDLVDIADEAQQCCYEGP